MLLVNGTREGHACDSHFLLHAIWIICMKNVCHFEGTCELVACKCKLPLNYPVYKITILPPLVTDLST